MSEKKKELKGINLRLVSDGVCSGTRLEDIETGRTVDNLCAIEWKLKVGDPVAIVTATFEMMPADIKIPGMLYADMISTDEDGKVVPVLIEAPAR